MHCRVQIRGLEKLSHLDRRQIIVLLIVVILFFVIISHFFVLQGTQLYDAKAGGWRDLGMLDVMQVRLLMLGL